MKRSFFLLFFCCTAIVIVFSTCRKTIHDRRSTATQTPESREYFGCRINGVSFVSESRTGAVFGSCSYTPFYNDSTGWLFKIVSDKFQSNCRSGSVSITLDSVKLEVGKSYILGTPGPKKNYGRYSFISGCSEDPVEVFTSDNLSGKVNINHIDFDKEVIKGTFYFSMKDATGKIYTIADGMFDRHFGPY